MLDERTVVVMMAMTQGVLAVIAASLRAGHPDDVRGIGSWALTMAFCAIGLLLVAYQVSLPLGPPQLLPNLFFYPAAALLATSVLRFFDRRVRPGPWVVGTLTAYVLGGLLSVQPEHAVWRVLMIMALLVVSIGLGLRATVASDDWRRGSGAKVIVSGQLMLALAVALRIGTALEGGVAILMSGVSATTLPLFLAGIHLGLVLITLGMILLATERMRRRLEGLANHDALTGVLTRRGFSALAAQAVASARREQPSIGFLIADIDWFKRINDQYGHQAGDAVLATVGRSLQALSRAGDVVARFGGEEFAVLLPNSDLAQVHEVAERMRCKIAAEVFPHNGRDLRVTMSFGVAAMPAATATVDTLYSRADAALYRAKSGGRNRVEAAEPCH